MNYKKAEWIIFPAIAGAVFTADQLLKLRSARTFDRKGGTRIPVRVVGRKSVPRLTRSFHKKDETQTSAHSSDWNVESQTSVPGKGIYFTYSENRGAAMNLGEKDPELVKKISVGLAAGFTGALAVLLAKDPGWKTGEVADKKPGGITGKTRGWMPGKMPGKMPGNVLAKTGLALVTGGAWSNVFDRFRRGYVTDYLIFDVGVPELKNVACNIADLAISTGMTMLALPAVLKGTVKTKRKQSRKPEKHA